MVKEYPETHQHGLISIEEVPDSIYWSFTRGQFKNVLVVGDLGIQVAKDGRIWICIDGVTFLRFKPETRKEANS